MVCEGVTSRLEVAQEILNILTLQDEIKITKVTSEFFKKEYFTKRPSSERLICKKLELRNLSVMRHWKTALKEYLDEYYCDYI